MNLIYNSILNVASSAATAAATPAASGATQQSPANAGLMQVGMIVLFVAIVYFLMIRPQKKQQKEHQQMIEALQIGDFVQLNSGIIGKIKRYDKASVTCKIEIDTNNHTVIEVVKTAIVGKVNEKTEA